MFEEYLWALPVVGLVLGAVLNRLRGMIGVFSFLAGGVLALAVWTVGLPIWQAVVIGALYIVGESWGWTKWIYCITFDNAHKPKGEGVAMTQAQYNTRWAYPKEVDAPNYEWVMQLFEDGWDKRDYKSYVWVGMILRGLLWWAPVFAAWGYFTGQWMLAAGVTVVLSVIFPITYRLAYDASVAGFKYLQKAEVAYGAVYGLAWGLVLLYA